ncbi:hypothetical protein PMAYCL1PPCAC_28774, partial [Pristionchus mayeri]
LQSLLYLTLLLVPHSLSFTECPTGSACIYHASCTVDYPTENSDWLTMEPRSFKVWNQSFCSDSNHTTNKLFIEPLSNKRWNITLMHQQINLGIILGDSLTILVNKSEAIFNTSLDDAIKIPIIKKGDTIQLVLESPKMVS